MILLQSVLGLMYVYIILLNLNNDQTVYMMLKLTTEGRVTRGQALTAPTMPSLIS